MSHKKRRSSKHKKRRSQPGFGKNASEGGRGSFIALVAGMTTTLATLMWGYSVLFMDLPKPKPRPQTSARVDEAVPATEFESFLKYATPDSLLERLSAQRIEIKKTTNDTSKAYLLKQQIRVTTRIIESDATREAKEFATLALLRNRKSLYGLHALGKIPSQSNLENFKLCFQRYLNDTNAEIYREAHICRLIYVLFEVVSGSIEPSEFTVALEDVLERFPADEIVLGSVRRQFDACIENDVETAKQLGEDLLRSAPGKDHPAAELFGYFLNRYYLIKANYKDLYVNRYANGRAGQRELEKQSIELLERDDTGEVVITEVNRIANWFEGQRDPAPARNIYQTMIQCGERRPGEKAGATLKTFGVKGLQRLDLIGKKLSLAGVDRMGTPVKESDFDKRVVMILFYAIRNDPSSLDYLNRFHQVGSHYAENSAPIRAIAVPTAPLNASEVTRRDGSQSATIFCDWNINERPVLLDRFPVTRVPYLLMLNHEGIVSRVNVPVDEFEQEAGLLLDRR